MASEGGSSEGPATDASNTPVIDPTVNVKELIGLEVRRLDDIRDSERGHIREIMEIRSDYDDKLREAESKRIDAIRAVDVGAVNRAAEVAATQAATLAAQVATSAETLRNQVSAASSAATIALAAALEPIQKDIADLRRVQYEQQGQKAAGVETKTDTSSASQRTMAILAAVMAALFFILAIASFALTLANKK